MTRREYTPEEIRNWKQHYGTRRWRAWECWLMNALDCRYWGCECEYWPPYGLCVIAGCKKHD